MGRQVLVVNGDGFYSSKARALKMQNLDEGNGKRKIWIIKNAWFSSWSHSANERAWLIVFFKLAYAVESVDEDSLKWSSSWRSA